MKKLFRTAGVILCAVALLFLAACDSSDYKKATELYEYGQYDQAIALFTQLADYKDSAQMIQQCTYSKAKNFYDSAKYAEALPLFDELGDYQDSALMAKQAKVFLAKEAYDLGNTAEAVNMLAEIIDFMDARVVLRAIMKKEIAETYYKYLEDGVELVNDCCETIKDNLYSKLFSGQSVMLTPSSLISGTDKDVVALKEIRNQMTAFYTEYSACFSEEVLALCEEDMVEADKVFRQTHNYAMRFYDTYGSNGFVQWFIATISSGSSSYSVDGLTDLVKDLEKAVNNLL